MRLHHLLAAASLGAAALVAACSSSQEPSSVAETAAALGFTDLPVPLNPPTLASFTQQIDHPVTAAPSVGTFTQRYWVSNQYASGPTAPVLFYLCGQGECDGSIAVNLADNARALGASIVGLEHRYYGKSRPFPAKEETLANMKYLTIHNVLEDAAAFITWAQTSPGLGGKWIAVGTSYSGMLAAFLRETHPELVVGAWASSAPVDVREAFWGEDKIVAEALGPACLKQFQDVMTVAQSLWAQKDGPAYVKFCDKLFDYDGESFNRVEFLTSVSQLAEDALTYGAQADMCAAMAQAPDPVTGLENYEDNVQPGPVDGGAAVGDAGPATLDAGAVAATSAPVLELAIPHVPLDDDATFYNSEDFYQSCTELGLFPIYNPDRSLSVMPDDQNALFWTNSCSYGGVGGALSTTATNSTYFQPFKGGKVSNVLFVNGSLDPYSQLSFDHPDAPPTGDTVFIVPGGIESEDMTNLQPSSPAGVALAHATFQKLATSWIGAAP